MAYDRYADGSTGRQVRLTMRTRSSEPVRPGRWMASRSEPFAVFLFGILKYALC